VQGRDFPFHVTFREILTMSNKIKPFLVEFYTKNPETGETGCDIQLAWVFARYSSEAREGASWLPNFDCVIRCDEHIEADDSRIGYSNPFEAFTPAPHRLHYWSGLEYTERCYCCGHNTKERSLVYIPVVEEGGDVPICKPCWEEIPDSDEFAEGEAYDRISAALHAGTENLQREEDERAYQQELRNQLKDSRK